MAGTLVIFLYVLISLNSVQCDYDGRVKSYTYENEVVLKDGGILEYSNNVKNFLVDGIHETLFQRLPEMGNNSKIGSACLEDIASLYSKAYRGHKWALKFLDSSSSVPPGLLDATQANFGDFDQCLEAANSINKHYQGKYCQFYVFRKPYKLDQATVSLDLGFLPGSPLVLAQCVPSSCSSHDVFELVSRALESFPLDTVDDVTCTTKETMALSNQIQKMGRQQKMSLAFVAIFCGLVVLATCSLSKNWLLWFSASRNTRDLFYYKKDKSDLRISRIDFNKVLSLTEVIMTHTIYLMDISFTPAIYYSNLTWARSLFQSATTQLIMREGAFPGFVFSAGTLLATGYHNGQRSWSSSPVTSKLGRYLPGLVAMIALEHLWHFIGTGPLYTTAANFNLAKCGNFVHNLLFTSNFRHCQQVCTAQTAFLSLDIQLCLFGSLVLPLIYRKPAFGIGVAAMLALLGNGILYYVAQMYSLGPVVNNMEDSMVKTNAHTTYIHFRPYTYMAPYMAGIVVTYLVNHGYRLKKRSRLLENLSTVMTIIGALAVLLYNPYKLITEALMPMFILTFKTFWLLIFVINAFLADFNERSKGLEKLAVTINHGDKEVKRDMKCSTSERTDGDSKVRRLQVEFDLIRGLATLSFAVFFVNYYVIRTDIFAERDLIRSSYYTLTRRWTYTIPFCWLAAYVFYVLFMAPLEHARKFLIGFIAWAWKAGSTSKL